MLIGIWPNAFLAAQQLVKSTPGIRENAANDAVSIIGCATMDGSLHLKACLSMLHLFFVVNYVY